MYVPLPLKFHFSILATMNNKKQDKKPLFAEVNLTGDEFWQSPSNHMQRTRFLKLVYVSYHFSVRSFKI